MDTIVLAIIILRIRAFGKKIMVHAHVCREPSSALYDFFYTMEAAQA